MTQKNVKKLTPTVIKKVDKKLDEKETMKVELDGVEYELDYDKVFRKTKHNNVLDGVIDFLRYSTDSNIKNMADYVSVYTSLLIIKEFTSLAVPDDIEEAFELLQVLVDTEIISKILNNLPEDELTSVFKTVENAMNDLTDRINELENEHLDLENEELDITVEEPTDEDFEEE